MKGSYLGVIGHAAMDVIMQVEHMPKPDTSTPVVEKIIRYGGTGANIAKAAGEMGVPVSLASWVGEDFPDDFTSSLKKSGIDLSDLVICKDRSTTTCWIINDGMHQQMVLVDQGAMGYPEEMKLPLSTMDSCQILHIGTGPPSFYREIVEISSNDIIAFDPAQEIHYLYEQDVFLDMLDKSKYFFCNEKEYEMALKFVDGRETDDILEHVEVMIVTKGKHGSVLCTKKETLDIPAYVPEKIIDPTGAGDAYRSGVYAGLYRDLPLEECCKIASARASFAVECAGPQEKQVSWEDVMVRMGN